MANRRVCGVQAPEALTGHLGPLKCSREVGRNGHAGEHKAHKTVVGVGRVNIIWRQVNQAGRPDVYRPERSEVTLPPPAFAMGLRCICPDYRQGHLHLPGCRAA